MSNLVKDLADTLRAVYAAQETGLPLEAIREQVKAVLERAEVASVVLGGMRSEQRADFEALVEFAPKDNATFSMLFALVRELDSAASLNCMLLNAATDSFHDERHRADRAEQQLATVTAERDELRREVERLTMLTQKLGAIVTRVRDHSLSFGLHDVGASNLSTALLVASVLAQCGEAVSPELEQAAKKWEADREDAITRAEKAEAERDALRSTLDLIANGAGEHSKASPTECRDLARATLAKLSGAR